MRFLAIPALSIFFFFLSAAAPLAQAPTSTNTGSPFGQPNIIRPAARSQYDVWTGAILYNTTNGKIFKNGITTDVTTLLTFEYPAATAGLQCEFHFYLDPTATLAGTGTFDVFSSLAPATQSTTSWPPGNQRNQFEGRIQAAEPGEAIFLPGYGNTAQLYNCPTGQTLGMELVPTGDYDDIEWVGKLAGAYILYHS